MDTESSPWLQLMIGKCGFPGNRHFMMAFFPWVCTFTCKGVINVSSVWGRKWIIGSYHGVTLWWDKVASSPQGYSLHLRMSGHGHYLLCLNQSIDSSTHCTLWWEAFQWPSFLRVNSSPLSRHVEVVSCLRQLNQSSIMSFPRPFPSWFLTFHWVHVDAHVCLWIDSNSKIFEITGHFLSGYSSTLECGMQWCCFLSLQKTATWGSFGPSLSGLFLPFVCGLFPVFEFETAIQGYS